MTGVNASIAPALPAGALLFQCFPSEAGSIPAVGERPRTGLVLTLNSDGPDSARIAALRWQAEFGKNAPLLLDGNRYSGQRRKLAGEDFDPNWISLQRRLGVPLLTDSGYVDGQDIDGLKSILRRAAALEAIATLPLALCWLQDSRSRAILIQEILAAGVPVALILEHQKDPLGVRAAVRGLIELQASGVPLLLLRSDLSALGALSFGAQAAAVGSRTSLRHLYPRNNKRRKGPTKPQVAAVIRECLAFRSLRSIFFAYSATPDSTVWICLCETCGGRSIGEWLPTISNEETRQVKAFQHSTEVILDLHTSLSDPRDPLALRQDSWIEKCRNAQERNIEIEAALDPLPWRAAPFLGAWRANAPVRPMSTP